MGDRANVAFIQRGWDPETQELRVEGILYAYYHWAGPDIRQITIAAVEAAKPRWGDAEYAMRMALTQMFGTWTGDTGAGFGMSPTDNEYDWYLVDWDKKVVALMPRGLFRQPMSAKVQAYESGTVPLTPFDSIQSLPPVE